jgi:hypothetical protein
MDDYSRSAILVPPRGYTANGESLGDEIHVDKPTSKLLFREFFRNYRQGQLYLYREALVNEI